MKAAQGVPDRFQERHLGADASNENRMRHPCHEAPRILGSWAGTKHGFEVPSSGFRVPTGRRAFGPSEQLDTAETAVVPYHLKPSNFQLPTSNF
ncbi:MAG: hypothetical protein Kow00109_10090 [Acidobacteriota bacterium]